ncbi:MAG: SDR family oxidoreductase [Colwellia polaris]|jgi:short-subunit dehydrogenase|tara:strand:- start:347 stop:1204 length:858 start_codon:yes stop_codon:yes gene_type:complete
MNEKKLCLVTGASGGIGRAISQELARAGYTVILQGRDLDKLIEIREELRHNSHIVLGELTNEKDRTRILNESFEYGDIELLVNNAGISCFSSFTDSDKAALVDLMEVNLLSPMLFTHEFLSRLTITNLNKQKVNEFNATVINVGSAFGSIGYPGFSLYCASKFGLRGFSESLSRELADSNIRVAYFAPRATNTNINSVKVDDMNKALGNASDSPEFVAKQFMVLLNSKKSRKFVGWPEKVFSRLNGAFPEVVDKAIGSKLNKIKRFINQDKNEKPILNVSLVEEK